MPQSPVRLWLPILPLLGCVAACLLACKLPSRAAPPPEPGPPAPLTLGAPPPWPALPVSRPQHVLTREPGNEGRFELPAKEALGPPLPGAFVGATRFEPHAAVAAAALDSNWLLVLARSGLWLVEAHSLAVRARVSEYASGDVAISKDGRQVAFGRCQSESCTVEVHAYPSWARKHSLAIPRPHRIRFSDDASHLAIASTADEAAAVVELGTGRITRLSADNEVNDVQIISVPKRWVALATDSDNVVVENWDTHAQVFETRPTMLSVNHRGWDQNAIAYDAKADELLVGGNDNTVWRFTGLSTGHPRLFAQLGFANDVEDILLLPGQTLVGLDSGSIDRIDSSGKVAPGLGRSAGWSSRGARLSRGPKGRALAVIDQTLYSWEPSASDVRRATFFSPSARWQQHATRHDVVLYAPVPGQLTTVVQRAYLPARPLGTQSARTVGLIQFKDQRIGVAALADGTRLFIGQGESGKLSVYRLAPGGLLSPRDDTTLPFRDTPLVSADGKRIGYRTAGYAVEVDSRKARVIAELDADERLSWQGSFWQACATRCRRLDRGSRTESSSRR